LCYIWHSVHKRLLDVANYFLREISVHSLMDELDLIFCESQIHHPKNLVLLKLFIGEDYVPKAQVRVGFLNLIEFFVDLYSESGRLYYLFPLIHKGRVHMCPLEVYNPAIKEEFCTILFPILVRIEERSHKAFISQYKRRD